MKYEDLCKANETINTVGIEHKDKNGNKTVKEYAEVNQRIKAFRMLYPEGFIHTELISNVDGVCVFKAEVGYYKSHTDYEDKVILGTGTAYEKETSSYINKTSYIENCETSAVGRALGMLGIGIDTSVASAEEVQNAVNNQECPKDPEPVKPTIDPQMKKDIELMAEKAGVPLTMVLIQAGVKTLDELTPTVGAQMRKALQRAIVRRQNAETPSETSEPVA